MENNIVQLLFCIAPDAIQHELSASMDSTIEQVTLRLSKELNLNPKSVRYPDFEKMQGKGGYAKMTLDAIGIDGRQELYEIQVAIVAPDVEGSILDGGENKHGAVLMVPFTGDKVYLGGFRNKKSNLVYHHAVTQTVITKKGKDTGKEKFHREAQTTVNITRGQQTKRECGTQMQRKDLMLDTSRDREMQTQKYLDSTEHLFIKSSAVLSIQCYWRGYMARCRAYNIHRARCQRDLEKQKEITRKQVEEEDKQKVEIQRRMNPKTFDDFEILYNELENWRQFETQKVRDTVSDNKEQKEQLAAVLEKETKLLQTINRLKQTANAENRRSRINKMMEVMCRPKKWQLSDGDVQEVHTTTTIRAKELMELYNGVTSTQLTTDERLDVLLHVKWTVNEFDCTLCSEIVDLIDREADMLHRGRKQNTLEGLRKRISNLFLQFIETPEFNPEAAQLDKFAT